MAEGESLAPKRFTSNLPPPKKLDLTARGEVPQSWKRFKRQWTNYSIASRLQEEPAEFQSAVFMTCIGDEALDVLEGLPLSTEDRLDLSKIINAMETFCIGERNEVFESYTFHKRNQKLGESIDAYFTELKQMARKCDFQDEDRMIRDRLVIGIADDQTRKKLLEKKKLSLGEALDICRAQEQATTHAKEMSSTENRVDRMQSGFKRKTPKRDNKVFTGSPVTSTRCRRCGKIHMAGKCPAKLATCYNCNKRGHFAQLCQNKLGKAKVNALDLSVSDEDAFLGTVTSTIESPWKAMISLNGKRVVFKIDTGADVTVIPEGLVPHGIQLTPTSRRFYGPGHLEVVAVGKFSAELQLMSGNKATQDIYVLKGQKEALLGRPAIQALDMIQRINLITEPEDVRQKDTTPPKNFSSKVKETYPELFSGLGKLEREYTIEIKEGAVPFSVSTPRRIALPLQKKVEEELKRLKEQKIIKEIHTPTDWCAPIAAVPKDNGTVRICVDLTKLNESVRRENFPLPTTDQLLPHLAGATVYTKLDCNRGFHQIPLSKESQELTTFITPFGRFAYRRMPFGISSGPEIFHREMSHLLSGIPGTICNIDDVLVSGKTQKEHDERLMKVLETLQKAGITLNEKCMFSVGKVKFLGHIISKNGVEVDPSKVESITQLSQPQNVSDVRRLLGMVNQVGKFIDNLATKTEPLRQLLKKENAWIWTPSHEKSFQDIKTALSTTPVLAHYDSKLETRVSADASKFGLGGVLFQKNGQDWKPVMFASRSMTSTEQRYAQIEKEALAVTWACEKFADFLIGLHSFQIETDHKPLVPLLHKKSLDDLPPRIQRFRMRLMRFSFTIFHTAGKNLHVADALSRAPVRNANADELKTEENLHIFVNALMQCLPASKKKLEEIKRLQDQDDDIKAVKEFCKTEWPKSSDECEAIKKLWYSKNSQLRKYWAVSQELTVHHGLLLYNSRLVIPEPLQADILSRIHEGHQGIVKCRAMAKTSVWWAGLSKQIEELIKACPTCEKHKEVRPEPLRPSTTPDYPFQKLGMDLFEWKGQTYLLVVDYFSRWVEISLLQKTTSQRTVEHCKSIFSRYGIPEVVISDNGPQFASCEFAHFAETYGFEHRTSSHRHPQGNGEAERAVQTVKRLLKKSTDPYIAMLNYRTTPLRQGLSPAELLMGRRLRSRVPVITSKLQPQKLNLKKFKLVDKHDKTQQKNYFDRRHRAQILPELPKNNPVWVKSPTTHEAVVMQKFNGQQEKGDERSYLVQTPSGVQRRNRLHLRWRSLHPTREATQSPQVTSLLPSYADRPPRSHQEAPEDTCPRSDRRSCSQDGPGNTKTSLPLTVSSDTSPSLHHTLKESTSQHTYTTRSGREIKPPKKFDI